MDHRSRPGRKPAGVRAVPAIGPILQVTVVVTRLEETVRRYVEGFGWRVLPAPDRYDEARAARWRAPRLAGARVATVGPPSPAGAPGTVRLVEDRQAVAPRPLRSYGWTALEVCVRDAEAATGRAVAAGWTLLRPPARLGGGTLPLVAGQVAGPDGEAVYLTQLFGEVPGFDLPAASREVDGVFIAVLGSPDLQAARSFLECRFAVRRASDRTSPVGVLNTVFGLPEGTRHRLSTLQLCGRACLEIDALPRGAVPRPRTAGSLPGGVAGVTVAGPQVPAAVHELPGGALLEVAGAGEAGR